MGEISNRGIESPGEEFSINQNGKWLRFEETTSKMSGEALVHSKNNHNPVDTLNEDHPRLKLCPVLSPEIDISNQDLADVIDVPATQSMMDDLYKVTQIGFSIIDLKGKILVATGWQDICIHFHRVNPETLKNCHESDLVLTRGVQQGEYRAYKCKNNLWDIVTPLIIGGEHIGNIYSGQYFFEDDTVDLDLFASQAKKYGFDTEAYLDAVRRVPRWDREKVRNLMVFFSKLADMISKLSYSNLQLAKSMVEQKKVEEALQEGQRDLNRAQAVAHTGSWRLDIRSNELLWSDEAHRIFGIPRGTVMNYETFISAVHPEDREYVDRQWQLALKTGKYDIEHRIISGEKEKWVREKAELEFDSQGMLQGGFGTVQDITEHKQSEEEIHILNQKLSRRALELEAANKELEAFSYSISHDLRAPLRSMDGFSLAILEDYADKLDDQGKEYLNYIRSSSQLMARLIDDLLDLSRVTRAEINPEMVNLSGLAEEIALELKKTQPERCVELVLAGDVEAYGDKALLKLVFTNLLDNAFKYTRKRNPSIIEFGVMEYQGEKAYFIRDNGAGFDMAYVDKLFKPFQRLHSTKEFSGTGIGLASVQRIISRMGGKVWAEGEVGRGATFYFTLCQD